MTYQTYKINKLKRNVFSLAMGVRIKRVSKSGEGDQVEG